MEGWSVHEIAKMAGILTLITVIAGGALANVYLVTKDRIAAVQLEREQAARQAALPQAAGFEADSGGGLVYYRGLAGGAGGEAVGYVVMAEGKGYSSTLRTVVGVDRELKITGIEIASQQETPGLGTRVTEPWFQEQFKGRGPGQLEVGRNADQQRIEAITGATISSRAVATSVRDALQRLEKVVR